MDRSKAILINLANLFLEKAVTPGDEGVSTAQAFRQFLTDAGHDVAEISDEELGRVLTEADGKQPDDESPQEGEGDPEASKEDVPTEKGPELPSRVFKKSVYDVERGVWLEEISQGEYKNSQ
jgi:hypothetical protein